MDTLDNETRDDSISIDPQIQHPPPPPLAAGRDLCGLVETGNG